MTAWREWTVFCWRTYPERKRRVVNVKTNWVVSVQFIDMGFRKRGPTDQQMRR